MWKLGKKILGAALATALTASLAVGAVAAAPVYSASIGKDTLSLYANGKAAGSYSLKNTDISLMSGKTGDLLLCYYNKGGEYRGITLGAQPSIVLAGSMNSLTVAKALDDKIAVTLASNGAVGTFSVESPNPITIQGNVSALTVSAPAKVTVAKGATVTKTSVSDKKAVVTIQPGATAGKPTATTGKKPAPAKSADKKPAATTNGSDVIRLTVKAINGDSGDSLDDLTDELNDNIKAVDVDTREEISGEAKWATSRSSLEEDGTFSFVFTPDDSTYEPVRGSAKVYVKSSAGDITLTLDSTKAALIKGGTDVKLKDLLDELNSAVYALDEKGNDVDGKAKWVSSSGTSADTGHSYEYTFKPKSSRYNSATGSVKLS